MGLNVTLKIQSYNSKFLTFFEDWYNGGRLPSTYLKAKLIEANKILDQFAATFECKCVGEKPPPPPAAATSSGTTKIPRTLKQPNVRVTTKIVCQIGVTLTIRSGIPDSK